MDRLKFEFHMLISKVWMAAAEFFIETKNLTGCRICQNGYKKHYRKAGIALKRLESR